MAYDPNASSLQRAVGKLKTKQAAPPPAPAAGPKPGGPVQPPQPVGQVETNPMFALQRKRAEQSLNSQGQLQNDAIQRRFAAMGGLNSGAYIKAQETARQEADQNRQSAMESIDTAEAADVARQKEILSGREFQRAERLGSQDFSRQEREGSQKFAHMERLDSQNFTAGEAAKMREFEGYWKGVDSDFRQKALDVDTRLKEMGLELQAAESQATWAQVAQDDVGGYDNWNDINEQIQQSSPQYRRDWEKRTGKKWGT